MARTRSILVRCTLSGLMLVGFFTLAGVAHAESQGTLTVSGTVSGTFSIEFAACENRPPDEFRGVIQGSFAGQTATLVLDIRGYHGRGLYSARQSSVAGGAVLLSTPHGDFTSPGQSQTG